MANDVVVKVSADTKDAVSGLKNVEAAASGFKSKMESGFGSMATKFAAPVAAAGALAAVITSVGDEMGDIVDTAEKLGSTPETIQRLAAAGELAGASMEDISKGLIKANSAALDAVGGNEEAAEAFANFGINAAEFVDLPIEDKMKALAAGFQNGKSESENMDAALKILGKSGANLIPLLKAGPEEMSAAMNEASVVSAENAKTLDAAAEQLGKNWAFIKSVGISMLAGLINGFQWLVNTIGKALIYLENLPRGFKAAGEAAAAFQAEVDRENAEKNAAPSGKIATDTEAIAERSAARKKAAEDAAKAEKKAADEIAKLREENDKKQEEARIKALSLKQREAEIIKKLADLEKERYSRATDALRAEGIRGEKLDLNKELLENRKEQKDEADKAAKDEKKRKEDALKDAADAAKKKAKAERDAKKDALKDELEVAKDKLDALKAQDPSFTMDSLKQIGGGVSGANYKAAGSREEAWKKQVDLAQKQVDKLDAILDQLEKQNRTGPAGGGFNLPEE